MKVCLYLCLLIVGIAAEKKLNLEDIERDNLRAETRVKSENLKTEETKYLTKSSVNQEQYDTPIQYSPSTTPAPVYVPAQRINSAKYTPGDTYVPPTRYAVKEQTYQHESGPPTHHSVPLQYYNVYQEQYPRAGKAILPNAYQSHQVVYQPEIVVGNQLQAVQQNAVSQKYAKNIQKETVYFDIPMAQLLAYYPHLGISSGRNTGLSNQPPLNQLSTTQQISIPVYTSAYSQKPVTPVKPSYQTQYTTKHTAAVPPAFTTKIVKGVYTGPVTPKKFVTPSSTGSVYVPSDHQTQQHYGKNLLYTQAYFSPSQQQQQYQYQQSSVYSQPAAFYTHVTPVYADLYTREPTYVQENSLHGTVNQYNAQPHQLYVSATDSEDLSKQPQQVNHVEPQNYVEQIPEEPNTHFAPPRLAAQDFKSSITQLVAVPSQDEESVPVHHHDSSGPRSLLESYIPSRLIAAQDAARYRERPLKFESGFLPSKENFIHKKRKSE